MTTLGLGANTTIEPERDGTYYWDSVIFSVEGINFKVPRYQFVIGSTYFAEKLRSTKAGDSEVDEPTVTLEGATASQFRVFLKLLFPIHATSTTIKFSKEEWLVILELSTLWDFHDFRKLAKDHLESQLDDPIERIVVGRAVYTPRWVLEGYQTLVTRTECIREQESERIGHLTTVRLYILRHEQSIERASIISRFREEIHALEKSESDHMSTEERRVEEEKRVEEERQRLKREEEEKVAEEKQRAKEKEEAERRVPEKKEEPRVAEADGPAPDAKQPQGQEEAESNQEEEKPPKKPKSRKSERKSKKTEEQERRVKEVEAKAKEEREEAERKEREANESIQRKREEEMRMEEARLAKELTDAHRKRKEEEMRAVKEARLAKELADAQKRKEEEMRTEEARLAKELADAQKRKEEERIQWERSFNARPPSIMEIAAGLLPPYSRNSTQPPPRR
ncbi:hypothetical protein MD484_g473, partial [Candolleomyces efflorescens]